MQAADLGVSFRERPGLRGVPGLNGVAELFGEDPGEKMPQVGIWTRDRCTWRRL